MERWTGQAEFDKAIVCIERWGVTESFWSERRKYFYVDDRKYWHMGDVSSASPNDRPTLVNRTWLDVARYRDEARSLGFADEALDRLVDRWRLLLEKAKR